MFLNVCYEKLSINELLHKAANGDQKAIRFLYLETETYFKKFFYKIKKDRKFFVDLEFDEIKYNIYCYIPNVLCCLKQLDELQFKGLMKRKIYLLLVEHLRKLLRLKNKMHYKTVPFVYGEHLANNKQEDLEKTTEEYLTPRQIKTLIISILAYIKEHCSAFIYKVSLLVYEGCSVQSIAQQLDCNTHKVYVAIYKMRDLCQMHFGTQ